MLSPTAFSEIYNLGGFWFSNLFFNKCGEIYPHKKQNPITHNEGLFNGGGDFYDINAKGSSKDYSMQQRLIRVKQKK